MTKNLAPETVAAQAGGAMDEETGCIVPPLHLTTTFLRDPDNQYRKGYSYGRAGISMPRATLAQRNATTLISVRSLRPGDLLFFDQEGKKSSHVGIYLGDGRFVHAPSAGGRVRTDSLSAEFWKKHFVEARRV